MQEQQKISNKQRKKITKERLERKKKLMDVGNLSETAFEHLLYSLAQTEHPVPLLPPHKTPLETTTSADNKSLPPVPEKKRKKKKKKKKKKQKASQDTSPLRVTPLFPFSSKTTKHGESCSSLDSSSFSPTASQFVSSSTPSTFSQSLPTTKPRSNKIRDFWQAMSACLLNNPQINISAINLLCLEIDNIVNNRQTVNYSIISLFFLEFVIGKQPMLPGGNLKQIADYLKIDMNHADNLGFLPVSYALCAFKLNWINQELLYQAFRASQLNQIDQTGCTPFQLAINLGIKPSVLTNYGVLLGEEDIAESSQLEMQSLILAEEIEILRSTDNEITESEITQSELKEESPRPLKKLIDTISQQDMQALEQLKNEPRHFLKNPLFDEYKLLKFAVSHYNLHNRTADGRSFLKSLLSAQFFDVSKQPKTLDFVKLLKLSEIEELFNEHLRMREKEKKYEPPSPPPKSKESTCSFNSPIYFFGEHPETETADSPEKKKETTPTCSISLQKTPTDREE